MQVTKPGWIIKSVIASSESLFQGGSHVIQPLGSQGSLSEVKLKIQKDKYSTEMIDLKVLLGGGSNAPHFLIHKQSVTISKFDFLMPLATQELHYRFPQTHMSGVVNLRLTEMSFSGILDWTIKTFNLGEQSDDYFALQTDASEI